MSKLFEFIQSEPVISLVAFLLTYFGNSLVTVLANLSKSNKLVFVALRWAHGVFNRVDPDGNEPKSVSVKRITLGSLFVAFLVLPGCAGTLEESRAKAQLNYVGPVDVRYDQEIRVLRAGRISTIDSECKTLSNEERTLRYISIGAAFVAGSAGLLSLPVKSDRNEHILELTAAGFGIGAGVTHEWGAEVRSDYQAKGCDR
jgi:hypothetical protein